MSNQFDENLIRNQLESNIFVENKFAVNITVTFIFIYQKSETSDLCQILILSKI